MFWLKCYLLAIGVTTVSAQTAGLWEQYTGGGIGYKGYTKCVSGAVCSTLNGYFAECIPARTSTTTSCTTCLTYTPYCYDSRISNTVCTGCGTKLTTPICTLRQLTTRETTTTTTSKHSTSTFTTTTMSVTPKPTSTSTSSVTISTVSTIVVNKDPTGDPSDPENPLVTYTILESSGWTFTISPSQTGTAPPSSPTYCWPEVTVQAHLCDALGYPVTNGPCTYATSTYSVPCACIGRPPQTMGDNGGFNPYCGWYQGSNCEVPTITVLPESCPTTA